MSPITEILLRLALFEGLVLLILGSVLLCRRLSDQPLERIRMVQFGLLAVAVALLFTFTSVLPGRVHIPLSNAEHVPAQQELMSEALPKPAEKTIFVADTAKRTDIEIQTPFVPVAMRRPEAEHSFSPREFPISSPVEVETQATLVLPEPVTATAAPVPSQPGVRFRLSPGAVLLSLLGLPALLLLAWNTVARIKLHGILKRSERAFEFVQDLFHAIQGPSKYRVELRMSGDIDTPMVFGLFRSVLLLPSALCDGSKNSDAELRACLVHEWSHLRRGDLLTWNIVRLFQYPLWMQPFYWMLRSRLLADQDFLADDDAARSLSDRTDYADILLAMARSRLSSPPQNVLGMAGRKSQLTRRIEMLLNKTKPFSLTSNKCRLLLPLIVSAILVLFGGTIRLGAKADEKQAAVPILKKSDFFIEKFLDAVKEKRFDDAADCFSGSPLIDQWNAAELGKLFESCEKRNAVKRGIHPTRQPAVIVGPFEKYDTPVKKTHSNGGEVWESVIRFKNAAMSMGFVLGGDGKITGFEIVPLPNEPAPKNCGWRGGNGIAENRGYDCALTVECYDAEGKKLDAKNHAWDNLYVNVFQKVPGEEVNADDTDVWTDPADGTRWKRAESYQRQNGPGTGLFKENICEMKMLPAGTFRILLTAFQWKGDNGGSGNVFSEPVTLGSADKEKTIRLRLQTGGSLASNIIDAETGETLDACMTGLSCEHVPQMIGYGWHVKHNGRVRYDYLMPGKYAFEIYCRDFHATDPVYEPEQNRYEATVEVGKETKVTVKMRRREHTPEELDARWPYILTGTVRDDSGKPLADATVTVRRNDIFVSGKWPSTSTTSDQKGKFTLRFDPRSLQAMQMMNQPRPTPEKPDCMGFRVEVEKNGYVWKEIRTPSGEVQSAAIDEKGAVTNYSNHFCVEPAPADLSKLEYGSGDSKRKVKPGEIAYRLKPYEITVDMAEATVPQGPETATKNLPPLSFMKNKQEFEISGKVYDVDGKPAAGVAVVSYEDERTEASKPVVTDENGSFSLKGKKTFGIQASSKDGRKFFLHLISGEQLPVARLQPAKELTGQVVDKDGKPVAGATVGMYTVRRRNYFAQSDSEGRFTILYPQNVPGILSIFAFKSRAGFDYRLFGSKDGVLDANQPDVDWTKPFTLTLTGAAPIRLNVRWDDGSPASGITVTPWTFRNPNHPRMQASPAFDPSFNFAFLQYFSRKQVDADGIVELDWMPDWVDRMTFFYILGPWEGDEVLKRIEFRVSENQSREKTVVLYRPRKASGVVRFPDGKPAEGITVKCEGVDLKYDYKRFKTKTDKNGRYEIALDTEAAYVLGIENGDWDASPVNPLVVNAKTKFEELQNLDFTLRKTVQVRGNVVFGPEKEHLKGLKISFSVTGKTDLDLPKEKQLTPIEGQERRRGDEEGCGGSDLRYGLWLGNAAIDDNGNFSKRLGPGEYSIGINENYIGKSGFVRGLLPDDAKIIVPKDAEEEIVLNLEAEGSGNGRLRGKVLLSDGTPAAGAKLLGAFHSNGRTIDSLTPDFKAETDAEGNFDGARTLEPVWLFVQNNDGSQRALLSLDENTQTLDEPIRLQTPGSVTGRVVDFHGNTIPNIEIFYGVPVYGLFGYDDWHDKQQDFPPRIRSQLRFGGSVKADEDGKFQIDSIIVGEDCYIAYPAPKKDQRNGNDKFQIAKVRLENPDEKLDLGDCRVNPASMDGWKAPEQDTLPKFTARFLDDKTEKPLANQKVDIGWARIQPAEKPEESAPGILARTWPPTENRPFTGEYPVTDGNGRIEFSLPVQATVYDPKQIELQISCFRSLPGGSGPEAWNKIPYVMLYETMTGPFIENRDFTFRMIPYPTVTGKILDPEGKPIAGASLRLSTSRRSKPEDAKPIYAHKEFDTTTDADGVFRSMIAPEFDNGTLQCNAPNFVPCVFQLKDRDPEKIDDWTFTVQKGVDVSGRLTDPDGKGIAGLWVNFERSTTGGKPLAGNVYAVNNDELGRSVRSDAEGRFTASSLDAEVYAVSVTPIPCCPNAENAERVPRYDRPPMLEEYVFAQRKIDLQKTKDEPAAPKPLEIVGHPTVVLKFELIDETENRSALSYSRFSFHGRFSGNNENWGVQAEPERDGRRRERLAGTAHLPKGIPVLLSGSLVGSHINENGVGDILREKQNWTLEYRFGSDGEWKSCTESPASGDSIYRHVSGELGPIREGNPTLEIRIR